MQDAVATHVCQNDRPGMHESRSVGRDQLREVTSPHRYRTTHVSRQDLKYMKYSNRGCPNVQSRFTRASLTEFHASCDTMTDGTFDQQLAVLTVQPNHGSRERGAFCLFLSLEEQILHFEPGNITLVVDLDTELGQVLHFAGMIRVVSGRRAPSHENRARILFQDRQMISDSCA